MNKNKLLVLVRPEWLDLTSVVTTLKEEYHFVTPKICTTNGNLRKEAMVYDVDEMVDMINAGDLHLPVTMWDNEYYWYYNESFNKDKTVYATTVEGYRRLLENIDMSVLDVKVIFFDCESPMDKLKAGMCDLESLNTYSKFKKSGDYHVRVSIGNIGEALCYVRDWLWD